MWRPQICGAQRKISLEWVGWTPHKFFDAMSGEPPSSQGFRRTAFAMMRQYTRAHAKSDDDDRVFVLEARHQLGRQFLCGPESAQPTEKSAIVVLAPHICEHHISRQMWSITFDAICGVRKYVAPSEKSLWSGSAGCHINSSMQ